MALYLAQVRGNKCGEEIGDDVQTNSPDAEKIDLVLDTIEGVRELARELGRRDSRCCLSGATLGSRLRLKAH